MTKEKGMINAFSQQAIESLAYYVYALIKDVSDYPFGSGGAVRYIRK